RWFLSVDRKFLPEKAIKEGKPTFRSITLDGDEIEFSTGFTDLHTVVYQELLRGRSFGVEDVKVGISVVEELRKQTATGPCQKSHPFLK
ncbi:MAG: oxidoreductase, partial [Halobacteriovoraceae bacterium]|nr:oxidoreductase [Halobacteriovoraceae bacterium]